MQRGHALVSVLTALSLWCLGGVSASAADPEIDKLLTSPVGKDWVTNGGNMTNQRYSTLKQINTDNVKQLKGARMARLNGSGIGGKYSAEATPLVKDGVMYVVTGNDDVFAINAETGELLWERKSGIDQKITTVCCGWLNRGLAMGEGMLFLGQLDTNVVALDIKTGEEVWETPIEQWQNGYVVTSASLYYDGIVYSGISGGEFGTRGRLTALECEDRQDSVARLYPARSRRGRQRQFAPRIRGCTAPLSTLFSKLGLRQSGVRRSPAATDWR